MGRPHTSAACLVRSFVVVSTLTARLCLAQPGDPYDEAMSVAAQHERGGQLAAAIGDLERVIPRYPQDFEIALRLGWLYLRASRLADAERLYRSALSRGGDAAEANVGLGLSLARQHRCKEAKVAFLAVLRSRPGDAGAVEGMKLCAARPLLLTAAVSTGVQLYPQRTATDGGTASLHGTVHLDGLLAQRFYLGATYRYRGIVPAIPILNSAALAGQHEAYFDAGYTAPKGGITLRYALLADQGGLRERSHHVGLTARVSPYGDGLLDLTASFYPDLTVLRGAPSWRIPIRWGVSVRPGLSVGWTPGQTQARPLVSGFVTLSLYRPLYGLWLGGKYGDEVRPAYLDVPVIYNLLQTLTYGAWCGVAVNVRGFSLQLSYALDRLEPTDGTAGSFTHSLTLGLGRGF